MRMYAPKDICIPFHTLLQYRLMNVIGGLLPYIQIILSLALIAAILLQKTGSSLGGAFGADNFSSGFHTRRGAEKVLFQATIVLAVLFALTALVGLMMR
jgi:preprotein translocase subunit SecG